MSRDGYEHLVVWQDAVRLVKAVYRLTARFPADEKAGMTAAMRRLVMALPGKIADATARCSPGDLADEINALRGSVRELESYTTLARHLGYITALGQWRMRRRLQRYVLLLQDESDALRQAATAATPPRMAA